MMLPDQNHLTWTRSALVAGALVVAALIPVVAGDNDSAAEPLAARPAIQDQPSPSKTGNRRECLSLRGLPVSVMDQRYEAVARDHDQSGDTAIPMRGGECWVKWSYDPDQHPTPRAYNVERVRFYQ